jgi:peptide deformylase
MILDIVTQDNPILRQTAEVVDEKDDLKELVSNMIETVKSVDGAGIAAPQVGISKCLVIIKDIDHPGQFFEMINPEIIWTSFDKQYEFEGCLSVLGEDGKPIHERVPRYKRIKATWQDLNGNKHEELIKNPLLARIIQHETDHLKGKLFIDYLEKE